ncbi:hypothetical protein Tco_1194194 [Tanacetum coccineum]
MQQQESLVTEITTLEANLSTNACLVTEGATLEACLVTEGITMDDNLVAKESTYDSVTSSKQLDECNSSVEKKDTVTSCFDSKEQHMQQLQMQASRQKEMCIKLFRSFQANTIFLLREDFISLNSNDECAFERVFLELFGNEFSTIKRMFSQNMDKLEEQLTNEKLHENDSKIALTALMTPF